MDTHKTLCVPHFALQESFQDFQALEDRITLVATKVVHLGDQLESANNRRSSLEEARDVLVYLDEFKSKSVPTSDVFIQANRVREGWGRVGGVVLHPFVSVTAPADS